MHLGIAIDNGDLVIVIAVGPVDRMSLNHVCIVLWLERTSKNIYVQEIYAISAVLGTTK